MAVVNREFDSIVADIIAVRIQGAERIAKEAVRAFELIAVQAYTEQSILADYIHTLTQAKEILEKTRPTEPALRNSLRMIWNEAILKKHTTIKGLHKAILDEFANVNKHFEDVVTHLPKIASQKIKHGMHVFTHCHSSGAVNTILDANVAGKKITVYNTEARPLYQGRITATELAKHGVPVVHYPDVGARLALKECDIVLLGADAIDSQLKVYNKIGSELICELAKQHNIPVYICTDSWKYDPMTSSLVKEHIEERKPQEVWADAPKGVKIRNYAFEKINPNLITGIACEFGIFKPEEFVAELKKRYPQLFSL